MNFADGNITDEKTTKTISTIMASLSMPNDSNLQTNLHQNEVIPTIINQYALSTSAVFPHSLDSQTLAQPASANMNKVARKPASINRPEREIECLSDGPVLRRFVSAQEAAGAMNAHYDSAVSSLRLCCSGRIKLFLGLSWRYATSK